MVLTNDHIQQLALRCNQLAFIHDELQFESIPEDVEDLKSLLILTAAEAGEYYKLRIPIAAEVKSGKNWAEVH